jgi:hypothetical protein
MMLDQDPGIKIAIQFRRNLFPRFVNSPFDSFLHEKKKLLIIAQSK